jgi:hypothetical protein
METADPMLPHVLLAQRLEKATYTEGEIKVKLLLGSTSAVTTGVGAGVGQ